MFTRGSRYKKSPVFQFPSGESTVFAGVQPRKITSAQGVIEHVLRDSERLEHLALYYYNDPQLWWRILDANQEILFEGELSHANQSGRVILIPPMDEGE
jgi:hypothetical protein